MSMEKTTKPVVVYGASGYTGMLIMEQLINENIPFIAAGRSESRIREMMAERVAGLENGDYEVVEVGHDVDALTELFRGAKVVCNTVGPFIKYYEPVVQAALNAGCHYLDTTGEQSYMNKVKTGFADAYREKGLLLAPATSYMYVPLQIAAELCLEQPSIDSIDAVSVPTVGVTVGSANSIMSVMLEPALHLKQNELVEWELGDSAEVVTPGFSTTNLGLPWGGTSLPLYYSEDHRVLNCRAMVGFPNRALMEGLVSVAKRFKDDLKDATVEETEAVLNDFAKQMTPAMPPRERANIHRNVDHAVGRGCLGEVSATLFGIYPYITTAVIQAFAAKRLINDATNAVGFASACEAFGHRELLDLLEDRGLVSHRVNA